MKLRRLLAIMLLIALGTIQSPSLYAQFGDFFKDLKKVLDSEELSESKITQGIKEALQIGTNNALRNTFKPIVHTAMSKVGVTNKYQELEAKVRSMPLTERWSLSLDDYVTDKALDGLFLMVAEEERKIRQDPTARVTDVLKEVFGSRSH